VGLDLHPQLRLARSFYQAHIGIAESSKRLRSIQQSLNLHLHGWPPGLVSPDAYTHREPFVPAMSSPTFKASSRVARQGHKSRVNHRCFPNTVNRGVNKLRQPRLYYPFVTHRLCQTAILFFWGLRGSSRGALDTRTK
jgi:hypothetical protein